MRPELIIPPPRIARAHRDLLLLVALVTLVTCLALGAVTLFVWAVDSAAHYVARDPSVKRAVGDELEILRDHAFDQLPKVSGFSAGFDGEVFLDCVTDDEVFLHDDATVPKIYRILTPDSTSWIARANTCVTFVYDGELERWRMAGFPQH